MKRNILVADGERDFVTLLRDHLQSEGTILRQLEEEVIGCEVKTWCEI